jgi:tetratricopeptide (TPR) repeat protein
VAANNLAALIADHQRSPERLDYALDLTERLRGSNNPLYLDTIGWVNYRVGNTLEAVSLLERAVQTARGVSGLEAQVPQLQYHLGMAYLESDNVEEAKRALAAAVDGAGSNTFPGLEEARETLAQL